jgi:regulator of nucleoside diphosphate kinase
MLDARLDLVNRNLFVNESTFVHIKANHRRPRPRVYRTTPGFYNVRMAAPIVTEADYANLSLLHSAALKRRLALAKRVVSDATPANLVTMQSEVVFRDARGGESRYVRIVYPMEADPAAGRISVLSPLGLVLLGASVGDVVEIDGGRIIIDAVLHQPESSLRSFLVVRE